MLFLIVIVIKIILIWFSVTTGQAFLNEKNNLDEIQTPKTRIVEYIIPDLSTANEPSIVSVQMPYYWVAGNSQVITYDAQSALWSNQQITITLSSPNASVPLTTPVTLTVGTGMHPERQVTLPVSYTTGISSTEIIAEISRDNETFVTPVITTTVLGANFIADKAGSNFGAGVEFVVVLILTVLVILFVW